MGASLYELTGQALLLKKMAEDSEVDPQVFSDTLETLDFEIEEKADAYAKIIRMLEGQEDTLEAEIARLTGRKKMLENKVERMKRNLEQSMILLNKRKFQTDLFSFNIQKNPASVNIIGDVPEEFLVHLEPRVDKKAIIAYVKEHGNTDFAELTQSESLRIR